MIRATVNQGFDPPFDPPDMTDIVGDEVMNRAREAVRRFKTGATRDQDANKFDYEGFLSPLVLERFAEYMHGHRKQPDGQMRDSDNWQRGIPLDAYMKSGWRHFMDVWKEHRGIATADGLETALCAVLFNASGMLHEVLKGRHAAAEGVRHNEALGLYQMPLADKDAD